MSERASSSLPSAGAGSAAPSMENFKLVSSWPLSAWRSRARGRGFSLRPAQHLLPVPVDHEPAARFAHEPDHDWNVVEDGLEDLLLRLEILLRLFPLRDVAGYA